MVSRLDDNERARHLSQTLHKFLKEDLQLPLGRFGTKKAGLETFGALLGIHRASNTLFPQRKAAQELKVPCLLTRRFPTTFTGRLVHYEDCDVALKEVIDKDGPTMDVHKMWRLVLWIFLGNGGHKHQAWHHLQGTPCGSRWRDDLRQPLEVLRWTIHAVHHTGGLMRVIGSDGLDKKSRLSHNRILWLCQWHQAVPKLTAKFHESPAAFRRQLSEIPGLGGDLTQKEVLILLAASKYKPLAAVGQDELPFGMGARNGAKAFLGVEMRTGRDSGKYYNDTLKTLVPQLEASITRLFPKLPPAMKKVSLGDIEPCLCGAFIYAKMVERLRSMIPSGRVNAEDLEPAWEAICRLGTPAGFIPHTRAGKPEVGGSEVPVPKVPYRHFKLAKVPPRRDLNKKRLFRMWGPPPAGVKRRKLA